MIFRDFSLIPTGFRRNPLSYRRLAVILASISGGQSLGKPLPDLSRQGQSLCEGPFSVSCRKSEPFKPSDAVGFDEKSPKCPRHQDFNGLMFSHLHPAVWDCGDILTGVGS